MYPIQGSLLVFSDFLIVQIRDGPHSPQVPSHATPWRSPLTPPLRLWLQAPVEGDFDGVARLGFDHPGTAQGILVEARPARGQDGATRRSQMTTAGSWGTEGREAALLGGQMNKYTKYISLKCIHTQVLFLCLENDVNYINCEFRLLGPLWICSFASFGILLKTREKGKEPYKQSPCHSRRAEYS